MVVAVLLRGGMLLTLTGVRGVGLTVIVLDVIFLA